MTKWTCALCQQEDGDTEELLGPHRETADVQTQRFNIRHCFMLTDVSHFVSIYTRSVVSGFTGFCCYVCSQEKIISEGQQTEVEPSNPVLADDLDLLTSSQLRIESLVGCVDFLFCFIYTVHSCIQSSGLDQSFVTHSSVHEVIFFNAGRGIFSDVGTYCKIKQRSMLFLTFCDLTIYRGFIFWFKQRSFWNFNHHFVAAKGCAAGEKRRQDQSEPVQRWTSSTWGHTESLVCLSIFLVHCSHQVGTAELRWSSCSIEVLCLSAGRQWHQGAAGSSESHCRCSDVQKVKHKLQFNADVCGPFSSTLCHIPFTLILWFLSCPRCTGALQAAVCRVGLLVPIIFFLINLTFMAVGSCADHHDLLAFLMLQPYCSVHYDASPPIWPENICPKYIVNICKKIPHSICCCHVNVCVLAVHCFVENNVNKCSLYCLLKVALKKIHHKKKWNFKQLFLFHWYFIRNNMNVYKITILPEWISSIQHAKFYWIPP